ncbi:hypothetical protein Q4489_12645 [Thalassotalea sp. 1_MG-2023]|uniref:hypothetical protein n=1 Tax=Thalassotalea sp. 1_MG-2023 TaxID=3062680 RepID=UPI0026E237D8|nr:hypothetical protein [Thalassotalea sp. 1_MG-2023]MDO6427869.1 hypothetical protein [Thalassotalea sp. 1_MG-2023]
MHSLTHTKTFLVTLAVLFIYLLNITTTLANDIVISIRDDVYHDYQRFLNGRNVLDINDFSGKTIRRDVVDMIIAQQALTLGGFNHTFKYHPGKLNFRNTKMIQQGTLLISFDSYWLADANALAEHVYISAPVIRHGEYVAGIYTSPNNKAVLAINSLDDLKQFTAISTPKWRTDWRTLESLPIKQLISEDEWLSQARLTHIQWVDFMLMAFHSTPDKSFTLDKIHLVPVKGVGVVLNDSRHFVISKKHPLGQQAFIAINKGLTLLRKKQLITKAYTQAGFFIDKNNIKIINK